MAGVATGGSMWKNILIGILTTVVAYSIVNLIKDRKEKKKEKEKIKTETIQAWNSLIRFEQQSTANYLAALCIEDPLTQLESLIYEKDQLSKNYAIIADKSGIDDDLISFATRAVGNADEIKKLLEKYQDEFKKVNPADPKSPTTYAAIDSIYAERITMARERDMESLTKMLANLNKKYGNEFLVPADEAISTDGLTGKWKESGVDKFLEIEADNTLTMTVDGTTFKGKWELAGKKLNITFDGENDINTIHIIRYHPKFFRYTLNDESEERQCCKK
jgi:hypothetical protein